MSILDKINGKADLEKLNKQELNDLTNELREVIVQTAQTNGGHLSSNLGVVELTTALHRVFDFPKDKLIFDVGHQCYAHKLLSGRKEKFSSLRKSGGLSGFPDKDESEYDLFTTGHAGSAIATGLGLCAARDKAGENYTVIVVVGDGAFSNGLSLEALNVCDKKPKNFILILNDNGMSISKNKNGFYNYISKATANKGYLKFKKGVKKVFGNSFVTKFLKKCRGAFKRLFNRNNYLEYFGFKFVGQIDGNDIQETVKILSRVKNVAKNKAVFLHVNTTKGLGHEQAETHAEDYHGVGVELKVGSGDFSNALGDKLCQVIEKDKSVVAITAGMALGTGLKKVCETHPQNFVDVGICEEYAVTYSAGLATGGAKPIVAIYSTFLQRAYDQLVHDVCLNNLPVVFCVDRAGLVGADGKTHQGVFDLSYLLHLPNMKVLAPSCIDELNRAVDYALTLNCPVAIRYPNGQVNGVANDDKEFCEWQKVCEGEDFAILAVGPRMLNLAKECVKNGLSATVYNARCVKPLDKGALNEIKDKKIITLEENSLIGGFGSLVSQYYQNNNERVCIKSFGVADKFVEHASVQEQLAQCGLTVENVVKSAKE